MTPAALRRIAPVALAILLQPGATHADPNPAPATKPRPGSEELVVEHTLADKGHYRLRGSGELSLPIEEAVSILTAFDQHCAEGCRWAVSSLDHVEILTDPATGDVVSWTRIDDVMDASYFQRASRRADGDAVELTVEIPDSETLERLATTKRPHQPFFHSQRVTWRLEPGDDGATRVDVEMEMRSDRFLINLMPNRIFEGAERNLQELFAHLKAAANGQNG